MINLSAYNSPCGELLLGESDGAVCLCDWISGCADPLRATSAEYVSGQLGRRCRIKNSRTLKKAKEELDGYFSGRRREFSVRLLFTGTQFRFFVWMELLKIPFGSTVSYSGFSEMMGRPSAARAVANALSSNPISIFVPCHRIIGSNGSLTGYRGGLKAKEYLLRLEGSIDVMPTLFSPDSL